MMHGQPSPYSGDSTGADGRPDSFGPDEEQRDRIAGTAVAFVNTLHTGQNVADHLLLLIAAVEDAGLLDLSKPAGGVGGEYLERIAALKEQADHAPIVIHHTASEQRPGGENRGYDIEVDRDGTVKDYRPLDGFAGQHMRNVRGWQGGDGSS